jgi:serine/threonine protein kinase/ABC-type branched-subunit amino acid transport system substrate-binding protein
MGAVLLAEDQRLNNKLVVIKELISDSSDTRQLQEDVRNFKREVATLAQLNHFLIPAVTDHFQEGSHYFMVEEYVAGENLEERLQRLGRPLPEAEVLTYASDILLVLEYLAKQKPPIVHRDVKPANIIISDNDGRAHLVDFGIARPDLAPDAARKQTTALGTPGYAPPEQYQGKADPRSDLYALAATMHHLLTNRDPREHAPFIYPPVRSLNPRISLDVERLLTRALQNDIQQRYQSATEMKEEVDQILEERHGLLGATLTTGPHRLPPTRSHSGSIGSNAGSGTTGTGARPQPSRTYSPPPPISPVPTTRPPSSPPPPPPSYPWSASPSQASSPPPRRQQQINYQQLQPARTKNGHLIASFLLLLLVLGLIAAVALGAFSGLLSHLGFGSTAATPAVAQTAPALPASIKGIGAFTVTNPQGQQERIGLSDGRVAFDTARASGDGSLKQQAAARFKDDDYAGALSYLAQAIAEDPNDAEALIYQENLHVLTSGAPYLTLVVGTMLSGPDIDIGREILQGAYIAQKEFNDSGGINGLRLRLLIASSGSQATYATTVAQQVVNTAQQDASIVGVMGWPLSSQSEDALGILARAQLPMVSATASSDQLSGASPYFFRVAPSNASQGLAGANYALQTLHARRVAIFYDPGDAYSSNLASDFRTPFVRGGGQVASEQQYQRGQGAQLPALLQAALKANPDLIYFAGYASDIGPLLQNLPTSGPFANLLVLGGDALYQPQGYSGQKQAFTRLRFTSFAYPDEWGYLRHAQPAFFADYAQIYSGNGQYTGYGYTRADFNTILAYDAMQALLEGCRRALVGGKQGTSGSDLRQALTTITGSGAIQGISGQIAFDHQGNPIDKAVVILSVDPQGHIQIASIVGKFFL